jgi:hypothetical protein
MTDAELEAKLEYAEMLAGRLEHLSTDAAWTHRSRGLAEALRKHVDIFRGLAVAPENTSLGEMPFFERQINQAEKVLNAAAHALFDGVSFEEGGKK